MKPRPTVHQFFALLTAVAAVVAQDRNGSLRGVVSDQENGAPLVGAQVTIVELGWRAATTEQGTWSIADVPPGRYTLLFQKDEYVRAVRGDVVVGSGQLVEVSVALVSDFTDMEEFVVEDLRLDGASESGLLQLRLETPALMDSIGADLMSRAGASDAASALRLVSGASLQGGKTAVVRGLPDRYVSSRLNGVRLPSADEDKRAVELDQFPSAVIESVQVTKTFMPDQQGDASGGAVDVRLKGVPDEPFFVQYRTQASFNSQAYGRDDFLTSRGGGVGFLGKSHRTPQLASLGGNWSGAVGTEEGESPQDSKWSLAMGGKHELDDGVRVGLLASTFYERDSSFYDDGIDDSYWVTQPGAPMTPRRSQASGAEDFKTSLFDVARATESVRWGALTVLGVETDRHQLKLAYLFTQATEDAATLAQDTRGKQYFFPGHDPSDPSTPGHDQPDAAPYLRLETLQYTERSTGTLMLQGQHQLDDGDDSAPSLDWSLARSSAEAIQPDKRQFGEQWRPARQIGPFSLPALHLPFKPGANFNLGNLQRIYKNVAEISDQYALALKLPFAGTEERNGYVELGTFHDRVRRSFDQETFSNFGDNSDFAGSFDVLWSRVFPTENHPITPSLFDVDYRGKQEIDAWYAMTSVPIGSWLELVGGARIETTKVGIVNTPEQNATWLPIGSLAPTQLNPGDADVRFDQQDVLPSISLIADVGSGVTLRFAYAETVARQTFKELTPILQQEYLGGPVFVGNPELRMSALRNWDFRADWVPYEGGLISVSLFRKDVDDAIEYEQRPAAFEVTTAVNYPDGRLEGVELECRQQLVEFADCLDGFGIGANATLIHSEVTLPEDEQAAFRQPNIAAPMVTRDMTNAPEHLYNAFVTWEQPDWGTKASVFYTVQGDTLVAGAGQAQGSFVPSVYALEYGTLNLSVSQALGDYVELQFGIKNLTDPDIATVYRSPYVGGDVRKTSHRDGIDYSIGIGGSIRF